MSQHNINLLENCSSSGESKDAGKVDESGTKVVEAEDGDEDAEAVEESLKQAQYELLVFLLITYF